MSSLSTGIRNGPGASDTGAVAGLDRTAAFARARRHSWLVRGLKIVFPIGIVGLLGLYGLILSTNKIVPVREGDKFDPGSFRPTKGGLAMVNPRYEGFNEDGGKFVVTAKRAIPDLKQMDRVALHGIDGTFTQADQKRTRLVATRGFYDNKKGELDLYDRIDVVSETGMKAQLNSAKVYIKQNKIVSTTPVAAQMAAGSIRANAMVLRTKKRVATFTNGVAVTLKPRPPGKGETPKGETRKSKSAGLAGNSDAPINVVARKLVVNDNLHLAIFKNGVRATQEQNTLIADELQVFYVGNAALPGAKAGKQAPQNGLGTSAGTKLKRIEALREVVMISADGRRATSDAAVFDAVGDTATLEGNVILTQGPNTVKGRRLLLDRKAQTALLTGKVELKQGRNLLYGGRLFVDRKRARSRLDSPAQAGGGSRRIFAMFYQNKARKGAAQSSRKSPRRKLPPGKARAAPMQFKTNPDAPIKIRADRFDIDDRAKSAVFKGKVVAKQGDITIKTTALIATYSGRSGLGLDGAGLTGLAMPRKGKAGAGGSAKSRQPTELTRVEARQKVVITTADGQSASGDWADFDIKGNSILMGGNVVLKQGSTEIYGEKLYINMTTGRTRIVPRRGALSAKAPAPGRKGASAGPGGRPCPPGRSCLRLIPGDLEQQLQGRKNGAERGARVGAGWTATTGSSVMRAQ